MVRTDTQLISNARAASHGLSSNYNRRKTLLLSIVLASASVMQGLIRRKPIPKHTSILTGEAWLNELLLGHPGRFKESMGMEKPVFKALLLYLKVKSRLRDSKYVSAAEQLAIFCHLVITGSTNRLLQERFQRSADTISK